MEKQNFKTMEYNHEQFKEEANKLLETAKCYEVILSTKDRIKCDSDELQRVVEGIKTGSMIKVKQAFINPSFIVTIVLDEERYGSLRSEVFGVLDENKRNIEYNYGSRLRGLPVFKSLKDIFEGTKLIAGDVKPLLNAPKL